MEDRHVWRRITTRSVEQPGYIFAHEYPSDGSVSSSQKNKLYRLENELTKWFKNDSCPRNRNSKYSTELLPDDLVAVTLTSRQNWVRGLVLEKKQSKSDLLRYRIQLIDYCSQDWFSEEAVRPLPREFNTNVLECQSMKIVLYGVEPAYFHIDLAAGNKLEGSMRFYDKDILFINRQFEDADSIHFEEICRVEEFYFGDIILKQNDGSEQNLKDLLLQYHSAIKIRNFERNIPEYIKIFRRATSAFDCDLAVRQLLFPSISFSDVEQSKDNRNHGDYYPCPPVEIEVPDYIKSRKSRKSDPHDRCEPTFSKTSKEKLPAVSIYDVDQSFDEHSKLIDKIVVVRGGPHNRFQPVVSFVESPLDSDTYQMLKRLQIRDMTRCQKYLIPAVLSGQNVTLIEGPGTGKTTGVSISLVSLMWRSSENKSRGLGARAIVVCPYAAQCELVQKNCLRIIQGRQNVSDPSGDPVSVNVAYGLGTALEEENAIDLLKGYDILACTPKRLLRLLEKEKVFHFGRLSHIVFDDMKTLLNSYGDEIEQILDYVKRKPKKRPQRIIISDCWIPELKPFIKEDIDLQRGSLLVSSYKDAALFVRLRSVWTCIDDEKKKRRNIIEMLNGDLELRNVLVAFSDDHDEINSVYTEIQRECSRPVYKIQNFELMNALDTVRDWQNDVIRGRYPVIFCTDYSLRNLQIHEADYLIHYSLPKSKTDFLFRFSVLLNRLQSVADVIMKPGEQRTHPRRWPTMCIYSNNRENDEQFPEIVKIMQQLGVEIPDTDRMRNILLQKEMVKKESGLCPNFKEFGRCHLESRCKFRHIVLQDDIPDKTLPLSGYIKIVIVYVYSATHYGVRILEHASKSTGPWSPVKGLPFPDVISLKMRRHFFHLQNRKIRIHNKVGDIAAYQRNDAFDRVKIIKFLQTEISKENEERKEHVPPKRALVKFIDKGREEEIPTICLMDLPESLASIPPGIVDVFVCNLLPVDGDIAWGSQITYIVRDKLTSLQNSENCYFVGKVALGLGRNLWLEWLRCEEVKAVFNETITLFSVSKMLKKQQLGISHEGHLPLLLRLCEDADLEEVHSDENMLNEDSAVETVPSSEDKVAGVEEMNPLTRNDYSKENVIARNVDTDDVPPIPYDSDMDSDVEISHSDVSIGLPEKNVSARNVDTGYIRPIPSSCNEDSDSGICHSAISIGLPKQGVSSGNVVTNNKPATNDKLSNNDYVFKKPNSVEPKGKITGSSSVSKQALKPQVKWRQDLTYIVVTIAVNSDPGNFRVQLTKTDDGRKDRLYFCAGMDDKFYEFSEILFRRVHVPSVKSYKSGVFVCIKLTKLLKDCKWAQLFRMKTPYRWVRMDESNIDSSDDDSYIRAPLPALTSRKNINGVVGDYDEHSNSNSDSADDFNTFGFVSED